MILYYIFVQCYCEVFRLSLHCLVAGNHHRPESANVPLLPANKDSDYKQTIQPKDAVPDSSTPTKSESASSAFLSMEGGKILSMTLLAVAAGGAAVYIITKRVSAVTSGRYC